MTPRRSRRGGGLLQTVAIAFFALALGAFVASTWMRHVGGQRSPALPQAGDSLAPPPVERSRIRVEVRNGSGIPGAAAEVTEFLRDAGFDVVDFGNAEAFGASRTVVIDRVGAPHRAREVAAALRGVPIRSEIDTTLYLDVTVLIGRDGPDLLAAESREEGSLWRRGLERLRALWR